MSISTHTLRGERDFIFFKINIAFLQFQLTRSVGSVTHVTKTADAIYPFQLTRSVGSVTIAIGVISPASKFQLTRSVGSVTVYMNIQALRQVISTHTLRGERDQVLPPLFA